MWVMQTAGCEVGGCGLFGFYVTQREIAAVVSSSESFYPVPSEFRVNVAVCYIVAVAEAYA